jgi:flagellar motor switch protein FliM
MDDKFLSQDEVDALLRGVGGDEEDDAPKPDDNGPRDYNLATQERIVRGRMPTLEIINERFARLVRIELFNFLRRTVEVSVGPVRVTKYSDFIRNLIVPTNLNLIHAHPLRGTGLMVFDPTLVFLVIDTMFGGDGRFHTRVEGRDFTATEQRIIQRILNIVFDTYSKSWAPVHPLNFEYIRSEMNTQFANIATPNEVVVAMTFTVEMGAHTAEMHFCLPYSMIEPLRDILSSPLQGEVLGIDKRWTKLMAQQVQSAEVTLVADLAKTNMTLRKVLEMKIGDVIPLKIEETIEATVDKVPVMKCKYGIFNGQYALRVEQLIKPSSDFDKRG